MYIGPTYVGADDSRRCVGSSIRQDLAPGVNDNRVAVGLTLRIVPTGLQSQETQYPIAKRQLSVYFV